VANPSSSLAAMVMRASRLSTDDLDDVSTSWSSRGTLRRSADFRHFPGAAVISVEELPRPQPGTYLLLDTDSALDAEDIDRSHGRRWSNYAPAAPCVSGGVRPISLHGDDLMAYMDETPQSRPGDFSLDAILAKQEESGHRRHQSVGVSTGNVFAADNETAQLYRLLDNPFSGHDYERTLPKQQVSQLN